MAAEAPGALVGTGRSADVYDLGNGRVLRRYRDQREPAWVAVEAEVMVRARACGVPVPEVFDVSGADIVMERAAGPTMLEFVGRRPWTAREQARSLARLHGLVHQVPASGLSTPPSATMRGLDGDVLLHGDLHPKNVILTAGGPMIIDWESARHGPAIDDVAMTWALLAFSEIPLPWLRAVVARRMRALFINSFVRAAGPLDDAWRMTAIRRRLADPHVLPSEAARMKKLALSA
jgi:aminoglycoside phosphotransferase (APT) family kinase protein